MLPVSPGSTLAMRLVLSRIRFVPSLVLRRGVADAQCLTVWLPGEPEAHLGLRLSCSHS